MMNDAPTTALTTAPLVSPAVGYAAALATVALWASAFPLIRIALQTFDPVPLAALRFAIATPIWLAWLAWRRPALPTPPHLGRLVLCGAIGIALYNVLLNSGQVTVSAGAASFIVNTVPVITTILAVLFLKERFRILAWIGTALSFAGVALIAMGQPGGLSFGAGTMLVFGAACCQAVFFVLQRPLIAAYGAKTCAAFVIGLGALCLAPWLPQAIAQAQAAPPVANMAVIYLGFVPAAIGYATWGTAQAFFGASRAANFLYLVPPVAVALAFLLTAETPGLTTLLGGAAAIAGVLIVNTRGRR
jgi:drug/metabolite transporter (DMT)-like permease